MLVHVVRRKYPGNPSQALGTAASAMLKIGNCLETLSADNSKLEKGTRRTATVSPSMGKHGLCPLSVAPLRQRLLDCCSRSQRFSCAALASADRAAALQHPLEPHLLCQLCLFQLHSLCQLHPLELHLLCQLHPLELCVCSLLLLARLHAPDTCCLCHAALPVSGSACTALPGRQRA